VSRAHANDFYCVTRINYSDCHMANARNGFIHLFSVSHLYITNYAFKYVLATASRAKVKTKHDRAELRMRALQFTADRGVSYSRQFRGKNLTKTQFSSSDERNSTPRLSIFVVEPLIE
jgi:hypothetical protein